MTPWRLVRQSLIHYRRTHLAVVAGTAVGAAVLVGALLVGDSVRYSLSRFARLRIGRVDLALVAGDRFFRDRLADDLTGETVAPVLQVRGVAWNPDGSSRANRVRVLGVDERFWALAPEQTPAVLPVEDGVVLNRHLAARLGATVGDEILLRIENPGTLPRDMPLATSDRGSVPVRLTVRGIASDESFGRFSLQADHLPPDNAFVSLPLLQSELDLHGRANLLLAATTLTPQAADDAVRRAWRLADAELELSESGGPGPEGPSFELSSRRVFIDPAVAEAIDLGGDDTTALLTYFVNELRHGEKVTPYSMVTAIEAPNDLFSDLGDDQIVINQWLADDLGAGPGDSIEIRYFVLGKDRRLVERNATFSVQSIVPIEGLAADRGLMPAFPGLHDVDNCRDWDPGIPIDLERIRDKDQAYWDQYRGTPKAFVTLETGQRLWQNRFGALTAIRFGGEGSGFGVQGSGKSTSKRVGNGKADLEQAILGQIRPAAVGLRFADVRTPALRASGDTLDFGTLFLGLSIFLLVGSLLLTGLLFVFGVEQRAEQAGTLAALGWCPGQIGRLYLAEGAVLAVAGASIGTAAGFVYTRTVLHGLSTIWSGAVGGSALMLHARWTTVVIGGGLGGLVALLAMAWAIRQQARRPASELLSSSEPVESVGAPGATRSKIALVLTAASTVAAAILFALALAGRFGGGGPALANAFFGIGSCLLVAGLGLSRIILGRLRQPAEQHLTVGRLGLRNAGRRAGRSMTVTALLACGCFLVIAVGSSRLSPPDDPTEHESGTGGFVLFGVSTLPLLHDLNSARGRDAFGLEDGDLSGVEVLAARVRDGDDASCLNLNRPQTPKLIGLNSDVLAERGSFTFVDHVSTSSSDSGWHQLRNDGGDEAVVPAVADQTTVAWGLGKSAGDRIRYTDERGRAFDVEIVSVIENSILQGHLIIDKTEFEKRFPSEAGQRMFLIDAPSERVAELKPLLMRALVDTGLELTPTLDRLAAFNTVENTFRAIFGALGALGLLLGSIGLAMVVLRNVFERRSELAILRSSGFDRASLYRLVMSEHGLLVLLGLACGVVAAFVAVWPTLRSSTAPAAYLGMGIVSVAAAANAFLWVWLATRFAVRGTLIDALRSE